MKVQKDNNCDYFCTDEITQYCLFPTLYYWKLLKKPTLIFLQQEDNQVLKADHYVSRRRC